jgi:hypothetical protein
MNKKVCYIFHYDNRCYSLLYPLAFFPALPVRNVNIVLTLNL